MLRRIPDWVYVIFGIALLLLVIMPGVVSVLAVGQEWYAIEYDAPTGIKPLEITLYEALPSSGKDQLSTKVTRVPAGDQVGTSMSDTLREFVSIETDARGTEYYCYPDAPSFTDSVMFGIAERDVYKTSDLLQKEQRVPVNIYSDSKQGELFAVMVYCRGR